jgi:phage terminase small subunit
MTEKKKPLKPKQEKLAKAIASGDTLNRAAKKAGYKSDRRNITTLVKKQDISRRVTELREKAEDAMECNRINFIRTIHARFINEEHRDAAKYGEMLAKCQGWNEPDKVDITGLDIEVIIGGKPIAIT